MTQDAIIYCRVSSQKQVTEGNGLASQETRCREYAKGKGYTVIDVFRDEGLSGKLLDRPNMKAMLSYLRKHRARNLVVIIDDISRLARNIENSYPFAYLHSARQAASLNHPPSSLVMIVIHVWSNICCRALRRISVRKMPNRCLIGMKARMQQGYWCFYPPPGYKFKKVSGHGKLLVRQEPAASIMAEAAGRVCLRAI